MSVTYLRAVGFSAAELNAIGFDLVALKLVGFRTDELNYAGFSLLTLAGAGFTDPASRTLSYSTTGISVGGGMVSVDSGTGEFTFTSTAGDLFPVSRTAGVGCSRRRVGGGVKSFVLDGAAVVQSAVAAHRVVEGLDVFEDRRGQLGAGSPGAAVE